MPLARPSRRSPEPSPTPFCGRVWLRLDPAWAHDPRATLEQNAAHEAAGLEFYSLCVTDSRLGTNEARRFLDEERERAHRVLAVMQQAKAQQDSQP